MPDKNNKSPEKLREYQSIVNESIDALNEQSVFSGTPFKVKEKPIILTKSFKQSKLIVTLSLLVVVNLIIFFVLHERYEHTHPLVSKSVTTNNTKSKKLVSPILEFASFHKLYTNSQDPTFYHDFDRLLETLSIPMSTRDRILSKEVKNLRFGITWSGNLQAKQPPQSE